MKMEQTVFRNVGL